MKARIILVFVLQLLLLTVMPQFVAIPLASGEPATIIVPDDYPTIQEAVTAANWGDTVYVKSGVYKEHITIGKSMSVIGENRSTVIIDAMGGGPYIDKKSGITVQGTWDVTLSGFTVQNTSKSVTYWSGCSCIYIEASASCIIKDNIVTNGRVGITAFSSNNITIEGNNALDVEVGVGFHGFSDNNTVVDNVITKGIDVGGYPCGIFFDGDTPSHYNTVASNHISNFSDACIYFNLPYHCDVIDNNVSDSMYGIHFQVGGANNSVIGNIVSGCEYGIRTDYADGNLVRANTVSGSYMAVAIGYESSFNTVVGNNASYSDMGIVVMDQSNNNTIVNNQVSNNSYGIAMLWQSNYTRIFHNNFVNNTDQVLLVDSYHSEWDNGCEGNFWDDYLGSDLDGDGLGDTPYNIDIDNQDNYPLMNLYWNPGDINHDLKVDIKDIATAAKAFGSYPDHPNWNPHADITGPILCIPDCKIDIRDIALAASFFGKTYE